LHQDLAVGDALIEAQARVSSNWKQWLRENCFLSVRTALLYQRLARHRAEIEAEIERAGELSLRAAVRLIAEPSTRNATPPKPSLVTAIKKRQYYPEGRWPMELRANAEAVKAACS
jgi:hypothetical protein